MDVNFKLFLANIIGFNAAKRNFIYREGYISDNTLIGRRFKHTNQWCDEVSKKRLNSGGCLWGNLFAKILQGFSYWVNGTHLIGKPLEFNNVQASDIMGWCTASLVDHETDFQTVDFPKGFEPKDWVNW